MESQRLNFSESTDSLLIFARLVGKYLQNALLFAFLNINHFVDKLLFRWYNNIFYLTANEKCVIIFSELCKE